MRKNSFNYQYYNNTLPSSLRALKLKVVVFNITIAPKQIVPYLTYTNLLRALIHVDCRVLGVTRSYSSVEYRAVVYIDALYSRKFCCLFEIFKLYAVSYI